MLRLILPVFLLFAVPLAAEEVADLTPRDGWEVHRTDKSFDALVAAALAATKSNGMGVVTQAGPTGMAAKRGITIPGNRVIGIFNNDFAVKILRLSPHAMIEAPVRLYVTENADGTATLSYKRPSEVFAPYAAEGGAGLAALASDLDARFAAIAAAAIRP